MGRVASTATLAAGRNVNIQTQRDDDHLCLAGSSVLEAIDPAGRLGRLYLTGVRGSVYDDGTTGFVGQLRLRTPIEPGVCP
jgi:hypothetical protein